MTSSLISLGLTGAPILCFADTQKNPFHDMWQCHSHHHHWVCKTENHNDTLLYSSSISNAEKRQAVAKALGWIPNTTDSKNSCNTCGGYYYFPAFPKISNINAPLTQVPSIIRSDSGAYQEGNATALKGHVFVSQPGRRLHADYAKVYQSQTHTVQKIEAHGNLKIRQPQTLVLAQNLKANLFSHKAKANNVYYLLKLRPDFSGTIPNDQNFTGFAHGYAQKVSQRSKTLFDFYKGTYATCSPEDKTWVLHAEHIQFNRSIGRGYAYNTWLSIQGLPIFYMPYFSFPINNNRQSGFLYGSVSNSSGNGTSIAIPYYFNIASDKDDTFTPTWYQKRGILLSNQFRFLTQHSTGLLQTSYIRDHKSGDDKNRGSVHFEQVSSLTPNLKISGQYNYISDKTFQSDFSQTGSVSAPSSIGLATEANTTVAPSNLSLQYTTPHWTINGALERYQIVDRSLSFTNRPYNTLPQITASAQYPNQISPFTFSMLGQYTDFQKSAFDGQKPLNGQRLIAEPTFSLPITTTYSFFNPSLKLNFLRYKLYNTTATSANVSQFPENNITKTIPQFDIDSGLHFIRNFSVSGQKYSQTLEPHVMYLFTPYMNQDDIPDFDTAPTSFDYSRLFSKNRFSGYDRIGDTNQVTYALNSILDDDNGAQILTAGIGQIYYFRNRKVTLCYPSKQCIINENPNYNNALSPIAGFINYTLNQHWHFKLSESYNTHSRRIEQQSYGLQYLANSQHIFNMSYSMNRQDFSLLTQAQILNGNPPPKSSQMNASTIWKFSPLWHFIGAWSYSTNKHKTIDQFGAIEFNQCSWALRLGIYRYLLTNDPNNPSNLSGNLKNTFMLQFLLKGLGGIGPSSLSTLAKQIPGYSKQSGF